MAKKGPKPKPLAERFWAKVQIGGPDDCWPWLGSTDRKGYGRILIGSLGIDRHMEVSSRAAWILAFGDIPAGQWVLHRCDNPGCCNPGHLFLGDAEANNADMRAKGRQSKGEHHSPFVRGERNGCALLTEAEIVEIRASSATLKEIGAQYGIHFTTVSDIRRRKTWRHVKEAA